MTPIKLKGFKINPFLWITFLCFFTSCFQKFSNYPLTIESVIDLFFIENENDSIINILKDEETLKYSNDIEQVKNIFLAAALCESDMPDSARTILLSIDSTSLKEVDNYYFKTVQAMVEFRLNNLEEFTNIATFLLTSEVKDIRCLALIQRLMSRTMNYYEKYEMAIHLLLNSSDNFRHAKLEKSEAINKKFLASYYAQLESYDLAINNLNEAEKILKYYNDQEELYYLYIIGLKTYLLLNQSNIARKYASLALTTLSGTLNNQKLASIYNYIGTIEKQDSNYTAAINMFGNVVQLENNFFGANKREIEAYISLASIYNTTGEYEKAKENVMLALSKVNNNENTYLKYEAYKELSVGYYNLDPYLAYNYLDTAKNNLKKYQELSSKGIADFVNTQYALNGAIDQIVQLQEIEKRNRIINILILVILGVIIVAYILVKNLNIRVKETSIELIKKNLVQLDYEDRIKEILTKQIKENQTSEMRSTIIFNKFNSWLEKDKKYLQSDLDLSMVAREIGTNRSYLSKSINQHGVGFSEVINSYRIREVIKIFGDDRDERNNYTLPELATIVGFKAKSVFYDSFRKETGMTPSQFKREYPIHNIIDD